MYAPKLNQTANKKSLIAQKKDTSSSSNLLLQQVSRMGKNPNPKEHADMLNRAPANQQAANQQLLLQLQRQYGNGYVNQVVQLARHKGGQTVTASTKKPVVQAKLTVNPAGDKYEQEADRVADNVVQKMNEPTALGASKQIQRQEMTPGIEEEDKTAQTKPEITSLQRQEITPGIEEEDKTAQTKPEITSLQRQEMTPEPEEEDKTAQTSLQRQEMTPEPEEEDKTAQTSLQREEMTPEPEEEEQTAQTSLQREEMTPEPEEEEQTAQTSLQRQEMTPEPEEEDKTAQTSLQRQEMTSEPEEEEQTAQTSLQRQEMTPEPEEEDQTAQTSLQREEMTPEPEEEEQTAQTSLQRQEMTPEPEEEEQTAQKKRQSNAKKHQIMAKEEQNKEKIAQKQLQKKGKDEEDKLVQMKLVKQSQGKKVATANLEASVQKEKGRGQPINKNIRGKLEQGFGADFSGVRIHTDGKSDELNQSIQARAFTTGQDIFFRQGAYDPSSKQGQQLLAHELTHVVQQSGDAVRAKSEVNLAPKENKVQTKTSLASSSVLQPVIQRQETPDEKTEPEQQPEPNQPDRKADAGAGEEQPQPPADNNTAGNQPPAESGTPNQPPTMGDASGNPAPPAENGSGFTSQSIGTRGNSDQEAPTSPEEDPAFQEVVNSTQELATQQQEHQPAPEKADEAQAAAEPPDNEVESKAEANQVEEMQQAETPEFDAAALKAKLMEKIADIAPKTLEEADDFEDDNKLDSVKDELNDNVKQEQDASQGQLEEKAEETPDTSGIEPKPVEQLPANDPGESAQDTNAQKAALKAKGQSEVETPLQEDSQKLDQQLAENDITEEQLKNSNEPDFQAAIDSKEEAQTNAEQAPPQYRQSEQELISNAEATAVTTAKKKTQEMQDARSEQFSEVGEQQLEAKGKDEQERTKVADDINQIYKNTKTNVDKILSDLDTKVVEEFEAGADEAKKVFEDYVGERMDKYKKDRYSGFLVGAAQWAIDQFLDLPDEVNVFYEEGREIFIDQMNGVIDKVVAIMSEGLTEAKAEINNGKQEIQNYIDQLPDDLKSVGQEAAANIQSKFEELEQSVNDKQDELIDTLANKYQENLEAVDARIEEMKEDNKGLFQKAIDSIVDVIKIIFEMTQLLMEVLARVAEVIPQILTDPIGFLKDLIAGIKQGFENFINNIEQNLQEGLLAWLTGTLAGTVIEMPKSLDIEGIFSLVTQILGFSPETIEQQVTERSQDGKQEQSSPSPQNSGQKRGSNNAGTQRQAEQDKTNAPSSEQSMADNRSMGNNNQADAGIDILTILSTQGMVGLWPVMQDQIGDLKAMVLDPIRDFVIETVIKAGIELIISLMTPASAFVKACKAIHEIVKFFIDRAEQIADLIKAILDSIKPIANGKKKEAGKNIENSLVKAIPVAIGFLASLLGLGDITGKVQEIIEKLRQPLEKAVDWVIEQGAKAAKGFSNKSKDKFGKDKQKDKGKPDERTGSTKGKENKQKEEKRHKLLAQQAVSELEKTDGKAKHYKTLRAEKEAQAKKIEKSYTRKLEKGIKLTVHFEDTAKDEKDKDIDFKVVIAPNTSTKAGTAPVDEPKDTKIESVVFPDVTQKMKKNWIDGTDTEGKLRDSCKVYLSGQERTRAVNNLRDDQIYDLYHGKEWFKGERMKKDPSKSAKSGENKEAIIAKSEQGSVKEMIFWEGELNKILLAIAIKFSILNEEAKPRSGKARAATNQQQGNKRKADEEEAKYAGPNQQEKYTKIKEQNGTFKAERINENQIKAVIEHKGPWKKGERKPSQAGVMQRQNAKNYVIDKHPELKERRDNEDRDTIRQNMNKNREEKKQLGERYEWLHIIGSSLGGQNTANNLVAGTYDANTEMIALEHHVARVAGEKNGKLKPTQDNPIKIEGTADVYKDTHIGRVLNLTVKHGKTTLATGKYNLENPKVITKDQYGEEEKRVGNQIESARNNNNQQNSQ